VRKGGVAVIGGDRFFLKEGENKTIRFDKDLNIGDYFLYLRYCSNHIDEDLKGKKKST